MTEWICEAHPECPWPHLDPADVTRECSGPGMLRSAQISGLVYQRDQARVQLAEKDAEIARLKAELYEAKTFTTCDECNNRVPYEEPLRLCDTCAAAEQESAAVALRALQHDIGVIEQEMRERSRRVQFWHGAEAGRVNGWADRLSILLSRGDATPPTQTPAP